MLTGGHACGAGTGLAGRDADPESAEADTGIGVFELVDRAGLEEAATTRLQPRAPPLSSEEWGTFFTADGVSAACTRTAYAVVVALAALQRVLYLPHGLLRTCILDSWLACQPAATCAVA